MLKSTLSLNNFGNDHFGPKNQKQKILRISVSLDCCLFETFPTNRAGTRKCVFCQLFHSFENFVTLKCRLWNFVSSIDTSDVSATDDIISWRKSLQKLFQKSSWKYWYRKSMHWNRMLNLYPHFLKFFRKFKFVKETSKIKALGNKQNWQIMQLVSCYLASLSIYFTKTAQINHSSQCLHSLFKQIWDAIFYPFEVIVLANETTMS